MSFDSEVLNYEIEIMFIDTRPADICVQVCVLHVRVLRHCLPFLALSFTSSLYTMLYFHSFFPFPFWNISQGEKASSFYYICTCQILCRIQPQFCNYSEKSAILLVQSKFSYYLPIGSLLSSLNMVWNKSDSVWRCF